MKKETSSKILLSFLLTSFLISILSVSILAADVDPNTVKENAKTGWMALFAVPMGFVEAILELVFGAQWINATRVFFLFLLTLVIWSIMPLILGDDKKTLNFWISLIIATISIIAIPPELLDTLVANYGAMGAAILTVIPFAIILVFSVRVQNAFLARVVWIFYCIYYFGLYAYKIVSAATAGTGSAGEYTLYGFAIIGGLLMFFLIGKIRNLIFYGEMDAVKETGHQIAHRGKLLHKLQKDELDMSYGKGVAGN